MTDQEILLKREVARLQEQTRLLLLQKQQLELKVEKMKCCENCFHNNKPVHYWRRLIMNQENKQEKRMEEAKKIV